MAEQQKYKIAIWNANGLQQHAQELKTFLYDQNIDIIMISETHFTKKHYLRIPKYKVYHTRHPSDKAHGGTAIIVRDSIKHHEREKFTKDYLQATSVTIEEERGPITMSAIYCPPKHLNKKEHFEGFFKTLGNKFFAGGDYNAKHPTWGSRLITPKGRELFKAMKANNLQHLSTGEPTYWPTNRNKIPDVIDFCITKGIDTKKCKVETCLDLSSDHSIVMLTVYSQILNKEKQPSLHNSKTDWDAFREKLDSLISLNQPLKTEVDIETAVEYLTKSIQEAAWSATPTYEAPHRKNEISTIVKDKIAEKRHLRKQWQLARTVENKRKLNKATKELKDWIQEEQNRGIQEYLESLRSTDATEYSLWKATRRLKRPLKHNPPIKNEDNTWARNDKEKAIVFSKHLENVFKPFPSGLSTQEENEITDFLGVPFQMNYLTVNSKLKK
jgi:hypothetical protein